MTDEEEIEPEFMMASPRSRDKMQRILEHIGRNPDTINFDPLTHEVSVGETVYPGSNVFEMIRQVTKARPVKAKNPHMPPGIFLMALGRSGMNPDLIPNNIMKQHVRLGRDQIGRGAIVKWVRYM